MNSRHFFLTGCLLEAGLFLVGAALCGWYGPGFLSDLHWSGKDFWWGATAVLPLAVMFWFTLRSSWESLAGIRRFLDREARPMFEGLSGIELFCLSLLAGVGEEFFFRGALQGGLALLVGVGPALVLASLVFGLFHPLTWAYLVLTALIGIYLGALWVWTGNLLAPIVTHALYDYLALWYLMKGPGCRGRDTA